MKKEIPLKRRLMPLSRRADFLAERLAKEQASGSKRDLSFDKAELSALLWVLRYFERGADGHRAKDV